MGCCRSNSTDEEEQPKCGMIKSEDRKCRDILCCFIFVVFWLGMVVVATLGMKNGNPKKLVFGTDYIGGICGVDELEHLPKIFYPEMADNILEATQEGIPLSDIRFTGICVKDCPKADDVDPVCDFHDDSKCYTVPMDTTEIFFRCLPFSQENKTFVSSKCLDPVDAEPNCTVSRFITGKCSEVCKVVSNTNLVEETQELYPNPIVDQMESIFLLLGRLMGDVESAGSLILLVGGGMSFALGMLWLVALKYFAGCMVWVTCFVVMISLTCLSLYCSIKGAVIPAHAFESLSKYAPMNVSSEFQAAQDTELAQFTIAAYVLWCLTLVLFLLMIAMMKRIRIAIAILRESSKCIQKMPLLLVWPVVPSLLVLVLVGYWMLVAGYILSSDDVSLDALQDAMNSVTNATTINTTSLAGVTALPSASSTEVLFAYHLFGFLWTNQLIQAISICTVGGAVSQYYWTLPDQFGQRDLGRFPLASALKRTLRFHIGSLCFGSFIIAVVQFARLVLEYIDHQTKDMQESNTVVRVVMKAVKCCLWCFEKLLKFLSKNAYIIIAMKGSSFCKAGRQAFMLILTNAARMATVNSISYFLLLLSKIAITSAITAFVFSSTTSDERYLQGGELELSSPFAPVLVAALLAWFISSTFMNVYDMAIDTILVCFCEDANLNNQGSSDYMSDELTKIMGGSPTSSGKKGKIINVSPKESANL